MAEELRYTKEHEWVRLAGDVATVGVTPYAAEQLGDIVFVELPAVGRVVEQSAPVGVIESVKAVSDIFSPLSGEVIEANEQLAATPELVNSDPLGEGWMVRLRVADVTEVEKLLDRAAYEELTREG